VLRGQRDGSLLPYSRLSRPEPLLFLPSSSSVVLTKMSAVRCTKYSLHTKVKLNSVAWVRERSTPTKRHAACRQSYCQLLRDRRCYVVSVTDPYGRILDFLDFLYSIYYFDFFF
jgi:hypothetical protein